jgi:hypothetical protein
VRHHLEGIAFLRDDRGTVLNDFVYESYESLEFASFNLHPLPGLQGSLGKAVSPYYE